MRNENVHVSWAMVFVSMSIAILVVCFDCVCQYSLCPKLLQAVIF